MRAAHYAEMARVEDLLWWYRCLHRLVGDQIDRWKVPSRGVILDAGCGTGGTGAALLRRFPNITVKGIDIAPEAVAAARARGIAAEQGSINELNLERCADAALCLDVLAHEGVDTSAALRSLARALKPGGLLLINAPAFEALRGGHDDAVSNVRRFRAPTLADKTANSGFEIISAGYWNCLLSPAVWLKRAWSKISPQGHQSDLHLPPWPVNQLLYALARGEILAARGARLPFGSSAYIVARRLDEHALSMAAAIKTPAITSPRQIP